jgi:maltose O-acetyltransferase
MKIKFAIGFVLYNLIAKRLPLSTSRVKIFGQKSFRAFCGRCIMKHCGKNVNIEKGVLFNRNCLLGNNSGIGENSRLYGTVTIGDNVMMGPMCTFYTSNHNFERTDIPMIKQGNNEEKSIVVGNDVWIGGGVTFLPGVKIGNGAVIGAASVVTHEVEDFTVVAGNPARVIKHRVEIN